MIDVQSQPDYRDIPLHKVGIKDLKYPIKVLDREKKFQDTVAIVNMFVDLPKNFRGTHMSRFVEVLEKHKHTMGIHVMEDILEEIRRVFDAKTAHLELRFPYFIKKKAPISGFESYMDYECALIGSKDDRRIDLVVEVNVPVLNVCPCSKEISEYGAHNQRGIVKIQVRMKKFVWFEELIEIAERSASAPLYALLKREDEKYITERSYRNPKFVEDVVRDVALELKKDKRLKWFLVEALNFESIHNHNAYACVASQHLGG